MTRARAEAGFTLVEMLVALFVVAFLATAGASLLVSTLRAGAQVDERAGALRALQVSRALMQDDFAALTGRAAIPPGGFPPARGLATGSQAGDGVLVVFIRNGWPALEGEPPRSDLMRVAYGLDGDRLVRRSWARPDATRSTPVVEQVLLEGVDGASIRFSAGGEWSDTWRTFGEGDDARLPEAVEVTLRFQTGEPLVQRFLTGAR